MKWLLRLGLGASIGGAGAGAMSWDEYLDTCPLQFDAAVEFAQRAADAMLEHAITHAKRTEPILVQDGPGIRVAFTARVLSTFTAPNQGRIERSVGPEEFPVDNVGVAIAIGKDACAAGAKVFRDFLSATSTGRQQRGAIDGH